jgi:hypothetical protein
MAAQSAIPLSFDTEDPEALKRDLERLSSGLSAYLGGITGQPHAAVVQPRLRSLPLNSTKAAFGFITPVALPNTDDVLNISLPRPEARNGGLSCIVARSTTTGTIHLSAPGSLVNGVSIATLVNSIGFYELLFDGQNYYTAPGGTAVEW